MPELIDKLDQGQKKALDAKDFTSFYGLVIFKAILQNEPEIVKNLPTIEPEVRHGQMIEGRYPNDNKCSECGQEFRDEIGFIIQDDDGEFHYPKRCHECGCYWDGGC